MCFGVLLDSIFGGEGWVFLFFQSFSLRILVVIKDVFKQDVDGGTQNYMLVFSRTQNSFMLLYSFFFFMLFIFFCLCSQKSEKDIHVMKGFTVCGVSLLKLHNNGVLENNF